MKHCIIWSYKKIINIVEYDWCIYVNDILNTIYHLLVLWKERRKNMRLDKFLKVSRVIKRRTVANEAADNGRVSVNGKVVKPSYEVKVGDIVEIRFGDKVSKFEIIEIPKVQGRNMGELIKIL